VKKITEVVHREGEVPREWFYLSILEFSISEVMNLDIEASSTVRSNICFDKSSNFDLYRSDIHFDVA
jgi:hypothetical protein